MLKMQFYLPDAKKERFAKNKFLCAWLASYKVILVNFSSKSEDHPKKLLQILYFFFVNLTL